LRAAVSGVYDATAANFTAAVAVGCRTAYEDLRSKAFLRKGVSQKVEEVGIYDI
jgi:hypothetical protein